MELEMPKVMECSVVNCAYNMMESCHAMVITVETGDTHGVCHLIPDDSYITIELVL